MKTQGLGMRRWMGMGLGVGLLAALATGCGQGSATDDETSAANEALDSVQTSSNESSVVAVSTDGVDTSSVDGTAVATDASARVQSALGSCVTVSVSGDTATYVLNDCTGPRGLLHATGTVTVVYGVSASGITANATSSGLQVNHATLDVNAQGIYTDVSGQKTLTVETQGSGTGNALGTPITHTGNYTVTYNSDTQCGTLDGSWNTTVGTRSGSTQVAGYARCADKCATAGTVTHQYKGPVRDVTVTLTFDGSASAKWSSSTGKSGTVNLSCTAN